MRSPCVETGVRNAAVVIGLVGLCIVGVGPIAMAQGTAAGTKPAAHTLIDGARQPDLIPQWFRWDKLLRRVGEAAQTPDSPIGTLVGQTLTIGPSELQVLRHEAKLHAQRESLTKEKMRAVMDGIDRNGKTPEQVQTELLAELANLDMESRQEILNARARVVERLSPDSLQLITSWVETHVVATTRVFLDPREADRFQLPW